MRTGKTSISGAKTVQELGDYWDTHDLSDHWDQTHTVDFEIDPGASATYYRVDSNLSTQIRAIAMSRGVSPETLLNLWIQEKVSS